MSETTFVFGSDNPACSGCGGPHPFDTSIPSEAWNRVVRGRGLPDYLCLTCIVRAFAEAGEDFTAELWSGAEIEAFDGLPMTVSFGRVKTP
jgi:hypothetical protein